MRPQGWLISGVCLFALVIGSCALVAVAFGSPGKGEIGGPPTINLGPPDEGTQTSQELVIGRGRTVGGPAEIVAYGWEEEEDSPPADFCLWIEQLPDKEVLFGACEVAPAQAGSVGMEMKIQRLPVPKSGATYIGGLVSPDVASVRISLRRPGSTRLFHAKPILGRVEGDLQQRLRQPDPFGFYYAQVRGLIKFRHVRAEAIDAAGNVIGTFGS